MCTFQKKQHEETFKAVPLSHQDLGAATVEAGHYTSKGLETLHFVPLSHLLLLELNP